MDSLTIERSKEQVACMFDSIAGNYDFLNHLLSLGIDIGWRKKAIRLLKDKHPKTVLDIATGTADLAIEALEAAPQKITGIDISEKMLSIGKKKLLKKGLLNSVELLKGDAENLSFQDASFDAITCAFGVRNFENLEKGLSEMYRVLKHDGFIIILEFSNPEKFPVRQFYNFYFRNILPFIGKIVSRHHSAYKYLPDTVRRFPNRENFTKILKKSGFSSVITYPMSLGVATIYTGEKR